MGKSRKSSAGAEEVEDLNASTVTWEDKVKYLSPISQPLATKKLTRKIYKTIKKARANKSLVQGVKQVQKALRKGQKGIVVLAGDVSPLDIISHVPVVCEESNIPYCFTPSKAEIGEAYGTKRSCCMVMIQSHKEFEEEFEECKTKIADLPTPY